MVGLTRFVPTAQDVERVSLRLRELVPAFERVVRPAVHSDQPPPLRRSLQFTDVALLGQLTEELQAVEEVIHASHRLSRRRPRPAGPELSGHRRGTSAVEEWLTQAPACHLRASYAKPGERRRPV